ncbi:unnamed protein product [Symbiodinium sp. CCMP2592]|nr:unnamed protein product [Symbiodinium sp. CCMP2592]
MPIKRPAASGSAKTPASAVAMKRPAASESEKTASKKPAKAPGPATAKTAAEETPEKRVKFRRLEAKESLSLSLESERPAEKTPEKWQGLLRLRADFSPGLRVDFSPAGSDATTKEVSGERLRKSSGTATPRDAAAKKPSSLAEHLYNQQCWGQLSLAQVRDIAVRACDDFAAAGAAPPPDLQMLGQLGENRTETHNLWRDLQRRTVKPFLQPCWENIPLSMGERQLPFFKPHYIFETLRDQRPQTFAASICPGEESVARFWRECGDHPALRQHPVRALPNFDKRAVPVVLHGDGVPITAIGASQKSCCFISWRSLLCRWTATRKQHYLICPVWSDHLAKTRQHNTVDAIWKQICDSFDGMLASAARHRSYFAVPVFCTGDLEWYNLTHGLPRWNSLRPCGLCSVQRKDMFQFLRVDNIEEDAWVIPRQHSCRLLIRTLSPKSVVPDLMHTKHLGVDQRICGSVIWLLVAEILPGSFDDNRASLLAQMRAFWSGTSMRGITNLTRGMFLGDKDDPMCKKTFPCLKAKAAETQACVQALEAIWTEHMDASKELHVLVQLVLQFSALIDRKLREEADSWHPGRKTCDELVTAAISMLQCMTRLTKEYLRQQRRLFQLTFKSHWLVHALQIAAWISPVHVWTYSGEDYMGLCHDILLAERVTVSKLETAIEKGMENLRHRSLDRCLAGLDDMTWKTALATHVAQFCSLEPLLHQLLKVCHNGLLPNSLLLKALQACHSRNNFEAVRPSHALGEQWLQSALSYFMLRLRMMTGKLRDLIDNEQLRKSFFSRAIKHQQELILGLLQIIKPELQVQDSDGAAKPWTACGANEDPQMPSEDEREIEKNFLELQRPSKAADHLACECTQCCKFQQHEERLQALQTSTAPLKRPSMKRPAAALAAAPAADAEPAVPAAVPREGEPEDFYRWGCSKCRSLVHGCGRCKDFADRGHNRYVRTEGGQWLDGFDFTPCVVKAGQRAFNPKWDPMDAASSFQARDFQWVAQLPVLWENNRAFRERSLNGQSLLRGIHQPGHGDREVVLGNIQCCKLNGEVLKVVLKLMGDEGCIFVAKVYLLHAAALEFHSNSGYPEAASLGAVAHSDGWGLKRMLSFLKRKWMRGQTPRDRLIRALVAEFQRAYETLRAAVGDRIARALRARGDDDDTDDPDGALDVDSDQCRAPAPALAEVFEAPPPAPAAVEEPVATAADVVLPAPASEVPQDGAPAETEDEEKAKDAMQDRPPSQEDLIAQLRIAELKLEAKRLQLGFVSRMAIERKRAVKQFAKSLPRGPIAVDSDDEANPSPPVKSAALLPTSAANPDALETQPFEMDTQTVQDVLTRLDQPVPSPPAKTFAELQTLVLSPQNTTSPVASPLVPPAETETPSPRGVPVAEITPVKTYASRDDQLQVKGANEDEKKARAAEKEAQKAEKATRGRGRGGRGRGRGNARKTSHAADELHHGGRPRKDQQDECPEIETGNGKNKGGRPRKDQQDECPESETGNGMNKGGRRKKDQQDECPETTGKAKKAKKGNAAAEAADAPALRVRGKRCAEVASQPKSKRVPVPVQTQSGYTWPLTFARRYRPRGDNYTQKLWEGCILAFKNVIVSHLEPGSQSAAQSDFFDFAKQFIPNDEKVKNFFRRKSAQTRLLSVFVLCILLLLWNESIDFDKDIDLAELFSGSGTLSKEFYYEGKEVVACDLKYGHSVQRFYVVGRIAVYGLVFFAAPGFLSPARQQEDHMLIPKALKATRR